MSTQTITLDRAASPHVGPPTASRPGSSPASPPSGRLHIGNYVGAIRPLLALAARPARPAVVFVADLHAMTTEHDPGRLRGAHPRARSDPARLRARGRATLFLQSACRRTPSWPTCSSARRRTAR